MQSAYFSVFSIKGTGPTSELTLYQFSAESLIQSLSFAMALVFLLGLLASQTHQSFCLCITPHTLTCWLHTSELGHACLLCRLWRFEFMFLSLCSNYSHPLSNIFSANIWNFSRMFGHQYYPDTEFVRSNLG